MNLATAERAAICDEFDRVGPEAPTLCGEWDTRDLLAHLLVRERKPWASAGIAVSALASLTDSAMASYASTPWRDNVERLRGGAPVWSPFRIGTVDALANGAEFFVHHEDVRRGRPGWKPRPPDTDRDDALWALLLRMGRLLHRGSPVGIVVRRPSGGSHVLRPGPGVVTIVGEPGELVLHAFGRDAVRIELEGAPADVAALASTSRGL